MVLLPQGTPGHPVAEAACADVIRRCGGDVRRLIDAPSGTLEAFANHIRRLKAINERARPLVVLYRTNPVAHAIIAVRRELEKRVPGLHQAPWIIVHDPKLDPFFETEAADLGDFDDSTAEAPIWSSPGGLHYLVARPGSGSGLEGRILQLLDRATTPPPSRSQ